MLRSALFFVIAALTLSAREVAITIDDLPAAQSGASACDPARLRSLTERLLKPLREHRVPATAFVIAGNCKELQPSEFASVIRMWRDAGVEIGNHTYSHKSLTTTPVDEYEADILNADSKLRKITGKKLRYFRSPMLHTGADRETKDRLEQFLKQHGYQQAPVTLDNSDWMFAYMYSAAIERGDQALADRIRSEYVPYLESVIEFFERRSVEVAGREFPQVMLLHANRLNAEMLPSIIDMFRRRGYRFVSLEAALRDDTYRMANTYAGRGGFSWIHRWSMTKGMPGKGEPDEPKWLLQAYEQSR